MEINSIIHAYMETVENRKAMEKQEENLKKMIYDFMGENTFAETGFYFMTIKETATTRLDTKALYKDFPDMKEVYGKTSISKSLVVTEKQQEKKTA